MNSFLNHQPKRWEVLLIVVVFGLIGVIIGLGF
jgi:hypothetical protein